MKEVPVSPGFLTPLFVFAASPRFVACLALCTTDSRKLMLTATIDLPLLLSLPLYQHFHHLPRQTRHWLHHQFFPFMPNCEDMLFSFCTAIERKLKLINYQQNRSAPFSLLPCRNFIIFPDQFVISVPKCDQMPSFLSRYLFLPQRLLAHCSVIYSLPVLC